MQGRSITYSQKYFKEGFSFCYIIVVVVVVVVAVVVVQKS
jgi:hypothetical protein